MFPNDNAIRRIGENGTAEHGKHLLPFLESENQRTVKVTLEALSRLMQDQGVQESHTATWR